MNPVEALAAILVCLNVALVARRSVWNYPTAIVAVVLYAAVFYKARLYSDMALQGFFLILNLYGWLSWARAQTDTGEIPVETLSPSARVQVAAGCLIATIGWGWLMWRFTDAAAPWWDASVAMLSVAAQLLLARRKVENWALWIVVDVSAVALYASRGLWPTAILYVLLLGLAIHGWRAWRATLPPARGPMVAA